SSGSSGSSGSGGGGCSYDTPSAPTSVNAINSSATCGQDDVHWGASYSNDGIQYYEIVWYFTDSAGYNQCKKTDNGSPTAIGRYGNGTPYQTGDQCWPRQNGITAKVAVRGWSWCGQASAWSTDTYVPIIAAPAKPSNLTAAPFCAGATSKATFNWTN